LGPELRIEICDIKHHSIEGKKIDEEKRKEEEEQQGLPPSSRPLDS